MGRKGIGKRTTGTDFERNLELVWDAYRKRGICDVEKVDPPTRNVSRRVIQLANPFLDYVGTWTEIGGRAIFLEAKSTQDPRLELGAGGVTSKQQAALVRWDRAGAVTGIVWHHRGEVKVITAATFKAAFSMDGVKSFKWRQIPPTPRGEGWIIWDVMASLADRR